jgi:hypothetical protein
LVFLDVKTKFPRLARDDIFGERVFGAAEAVPFKVLAG